MSSGRQSDPREGKQSLKKSQSFGKTQDPQKSSSLEDVGCTDFLLFRRPVNLCSEGQGSETSSHIISPTTSGVYYNEISRKLKPLSETVVMDDPVFLDPRNTDKLVFQRSRDSKSSARFDNSAENLVLKNTEEITNFSVHNFGPKAMENMQCAAERLRLGDYRKSSGEITTRSDTFFSDNLLDELNADSQGEECLSSENISQSYVPFQTKESTLRGPDKLTTELKEKKFFQEFWRKNFSLNQSQIVAFFGRRKKKKKKCKEPENPKKEFFQILTFPSAVSEEEDLETKLYLQKFYFNTLELIFVTGISLIMLSANMFKLSDITSKIFMDTSFGPVYEKDSEARNHTFLLYPPLRYSRTLDDFWAYAENTLIMLLYWDFYYKKLSAFQIDNDEKKFLSENQILGAARIRQVRVVKNLCQIHPYVKRFFDSCYPPYSVFSEETRPIRNDMNNTRTRDAWRFRNAEKLSSFVWGGISMYGGGGYYVDFPKTKDEAKEMMKELMENNWVTKATRAVFIEFNIYNANVNLFCICSIVVEMPAVGGIIPTASFDTVKLIRYLTFTDFFVLGCEIAFYLFISYDIYYMITEIRNEGLVYLFCLSNYLDMLIILFSFISFLINVTRYVYESILLDGIDRREGYTDLKVLKNLQTALNHTTAFMVFCTWMRLFLYLTFTKHMMQFQRTLRKSFKDMFVFMPMFFTIVIAFAIMGCILFGSKVHYYKTVIHSFLSVIQTFTGEFDYYDIFEVSPILGPIYYLLCIFFVLFVLINMFIAITNDSYMTVMSQVVPDAPRNGQYIKRGFINLVTCWKPSRPKKSFTRSERKRMLFRDIQNSLKRAGFSHDEIQIFFHKYDINCGNFLDGRTKTRIMKDVELKHINMSETSEQFQIYVLRRRLDEFRARMENWEVKLQPIIDKVDILLHRL